MASCDDVRASLPLTRRAVARLKLMNELPELPPSSGQSSAAAEKQLGIRIFEVPFSNKIVSHVE
jgi:hypothetical protein